ncbi:hypothetical protein [Streptomyces sp. NPDC093094]|uniref:hypothetical protein n=1 Tax=Streptomyces sp. NPDC093094 TaxID=3366026 RepID=UPI00380D2B6A
MTAFTQAATMVSIPPPPGNVLPVEIKTMPHRLRAYVDDPADPSWFAGNSLLPTEGNPTTSSSPTAHPA